MFYYQKKIGHTKEAKWRITWLQAMHNTAMAGESTWLS
jgi:hypothetical protein